MIVGAGEPPEKAEGERAPSLQPPQGITPPTESASAPLADVSKAPTMRPPALSPVPLRAASNPPSGGASGGGAAAQRGLGFTSVIRHLSLAGWLRWIHSNRSDAELRVRTPNGGSGSIWCSAGKIVDAEWGALTGEEALIAMLRLASGSVTIDFDGVERPHRIVRPTHELLRVVEGRPSRVSDLTPARATPAPSPTGTARDQPFRNSFSLSLPLEEGPHANSQRSRSELRPSRGVYFAGGLLLAAVVLAAFSFGRIRASSEGELAKLPEPERAQQITSGLLPPASPPRAQPEAFPTTPARRDLPVIPFAAIEVEPAQAEIWLDQALVGHGRLELAPIPDGAMHELRFVAAGHETRSLFFLDAPPAGRVILERASEYRSSKADTSAHEAAEVVSPRNDGAEEREPARNVRRRRAPPPPAEAAQPPVEHAPPVASTPVKKPMQIKLIEAHTPRVQVLD